MRIVLPAHQAESRVGHRALHRSVVSIFVWTLVGIAIWHFTVLVPDRFAGGIVGAFFSAWLGAAVSGFVIAGLRVPGDNPPGVDEVLFALPGAVIGLVACYVYGARTEQREPA